MPTSAASKGDHPADGGRADRLTHRDVVGRLSRDARRDLLRRSDRAGLLHLGGHFLALAVTGAGIVLSVPGWPFLMLPHGILLVFLFCPLHECVHRTPFRSNGLNIGVGYLLGFIYMLPTNWFRYFHLDHHRFTHDPDRDPELAQPLPSTRLGYAWLILGGPFWISQVKTLFRNALGLNRDSFIPAGAERSIVREARLFLLGYAVIAGLSVWTGSLTALWLWLVPMLLGQPFLRLYLLAEHTGCPHSPNMLENTRTTLTNPVIRFIAWNMPYHVEHHAYPAVPFHRLSTFHQAIRDDIAVTANGYVAASREVADAMLKVPDITAQK